MWKLSFVIERIELNMVEKEVAIVSFNKENQTHPTTSTIDSITM
jgi:hypothetical protein